jgi:hypothetical protein
VGAHQYFAKLGGALENTLGHYNRFVGAIEGRGGAFFHARKLGALVHDSEDMEIAESLSAAPRLLTGEDWAPSLTSDATNGADKN